MYSISIEACFCQLGFDIVDYLNPNGSGMSTRYQLCRKNGDSAVPTAKVQDPKGAGGIDGDP